MAIKAPIYQPLEEDILLIGIRHADWKLWEVLKIRQFLKAIGRLDHLAFEGRRNLHIATTIASPDHWESIAYTSFQGPKHFLDDNADYTEFLERYGVSGNLYVALRIAAILPTALKAQNSDAFLNIMERVPGALAEWFPDLQPRACEMVAIMRKLLIKLLEDGSGAILEGASEFIRNYLPPMRDREIYYPGILNMRGLQGDKGVLLGANHVERIVNLHQGTAPQLLPWSDYVKGLTPEVRKGIELIENTVAEVDA